MLQKSFPRTKSQAHNPSISLSVSHPFCLDLLLLSVREMITHPTLIFGSCIGFPEEFNRIIFHFAILGIIIIIISMILSSCAPFFPDSVRRRVPESMLSIHSLLCPSSCTKSRKITLRLPPLLPHQPSACCVHFFPSPALSSLFVRSLFVCQSVLLVFCIIPVIISEHSLPISRIRFPNVFFSCRPVQSAVSLCHCPVCLIACLLCLSHVLYVSYVMVLFCFLFYRKLIQSCSRCVCVFQCSRKCKCNV